MFHRIRQYELIDMGGQWFRPRAYGDPQLDGTWDGWIVFFPIGGGQAIAPPSRETTQSTLQALTTWADGLRLVYLEGALTRAVEAAQSHIVAQLEDSEYQALQDAERLETAAEVERTAAELDEAAARAARAEAERIRRDRLATESVLADADATVAKLEADELERRAKEARAVAADAGRRRKSKKK
jgi:hypothetical protein